MKSYTLVNEWRRRADGRLGGLHLRKAGSAAPRLDRGSGDYSSGAAACTHTSTCRTQYTHAAAQRANAHRSADRTRPAPTHERESLVWMSMCARVARAGGKRGTARLCRSSEAAEAKGLCVALAAVSTLVRFGAASARQDPHRVKLPAGRNLESGLSRSHTFRSMQWAKIRPAGASRSLDRGEREASSAKLARPCLRLLALLTVSYKLS